MWVILGALFVGGLLIKYWWIVVGVLIWRVVFPRLQATQAAAQRRAEALAAEQFAIAQRADQQHVWVYEGDPRGVYGHHFVALPD
jgi:hypothetical protein